MFVSYSACKCVQFRKRTFVNALLGLIHVQPALVKEAAGDDWNQVADDAIVSTAFNELDKDDQLEFKVPKFRVSSISSPIRACLCRGPSGFWKRVVM